MAGVSRSRTRCARTSARVLPGRFQQRDALVPRLVAAETQASAQLPTLIPRGVIAEWRRACQEGLAKH